VGTLGATVGCGGVGVVVWCGEFGMGGVDVVPGTALSTTEKQTT